MKRGSLCVIVVLMCNACIIAQNGRKRDVPKEGSEPKKIEWNSLDSLASSTVTTTNEERGNWYFKAKILKDARKAYEKIRSLIAKIEPMEDLFLSQRNQTDEELNRFYRDYGFQSGEVDEQLRSLIEEMKGLEASEGSLEREERSFLADLRQKKDSLEVVKQDFNQLQKFDAALNQAIVMLAGQVNKARVFDDQAWKSYEKIELVLSDEVAEDLYRGIENAYDNIVSIEKYLNKEFKIFFDTSLNSINELVGRIKKHVEALKVQGIALGEKMKTLLATENAAGREQERRELKQVEKEIARSQRAWSALLLDYSVTMWNGIKGFFTSSYELVRGWFIAKKPVLKEQSLQEEVGQDSVQKEGGENTPHTVEKQKDIPVPALPATINDFKTVAPEKEIMDRDKPVQPSVKKQRIESNASVSIDAVNLDEEQAYDDLPDLPV